MRFLQRVLPVLFLVPGVSTPAPAQQTSQTIPQPVTFPIYISDKRALVVAEVNGHRAIPLLFDTGTTDEIIGDDEAPTLNLERTGPSKIRDGATGQPVEGYSTAFQKVRIGRWEGADRPAQVGQIRLPDAAGVVGPYVFKGSLVRLELAAGRGTVLPAEGVDERGWYPYVGPADDALPAAPVSLAGKSFVAYLDTGNSEAISAPLAMASQLSLDGPPVKSGTARSASGTQDIYTGHLRGVAVIGPLRIANPEIRFVPGADRLNIGLPLLRQLQITLDPERRLTHIEPLAASRGLPKADVSPRQHS